MTTVSPAPTVPAQRAAQAQPSRLDSYRDFTTKVLRKCQSDPGARSALRSGIRKDMDAVPRMHQVIAHLVPPNAAEDTQRAYYAVAAMIAEQARRTQTATEDMEQADHAGGEEASRTDEAVPQASEETPPEDGATPSRDYGTSLGIAFALAVVNSPGRERTMRRGTAESRLNLLCKQGVTGFHRHLPASIRYLRSLDVPVDWARLLQDVIDWRRHSARITRRWLQDYYRRCQEEDRRAADTRDLQEPGSPDPN